jgi:hypothetical protein
MMTRVLLLVILLVTWSTISKAIAAPQQRFITGVGIGVGVRLDVESIPGTRRTDGSSVYLAKLLCGTILHREPQPLPPPPLLRPSADPSGAQLPLNSTDELVPGSGRPREGITFFERLLQVNPSEAVVIGAAGAAVAPSKNLYRNKLYYHAAASLAWLYLEEEGSPQKALEAFQRAKQQHEPDPHLMDTLGWIYYRLGDHERALKVLDSISESPGGLPAVHYHLAQIHFDRGRLDTAQREVEKALNSGKEFEGKRDAETLRRQIEATVNGR